MTLSQIDFQVALERGRSRVAIDAETLIKTSEMLDAIAIRGDAAIRGLAARFGESGRIYRPVELADALTRLAQPKAELLTRVAARIKDFAAVQRAAFGDVSVEVAGATLSHRLKPVARAGCYVPGGRYPLPSTLFMTVLTAKVAGVEEVVVCCPRPTDEILAAAAIAGADYVVALGGVQAVASMTYGYGGAPVCDVIVGPGNRWVSAAKQLLSAVVRIDLPAGPSELVVVADKTADPERVAADLIAQAEHDVDAFVVAIGIDGFQPAKLAQALARQMSQLPSSIQDIAQQGLTNGFYTAAATRADAATLTNLLAPEHLSVQVQKPAALLSQCDHFGSAFVGNMASEALGDYGIGPNHVLPTGGAARRYGALSVLNFLRVQTLIVADNLDGDVQDDSEALAMIEGLVGHARSIEVRRGERQL